MKKLYALIFPFILLSTFTSCKEDRPKVENTEQASGSIKGQSAILRNEYTHLFSDPTKADTFRITLAGDSILTAKALLEIVKYDGSVLYQDTFASNFLIDYGIAHNPTRQQQEAYIEERVNTFFKVENFMQPALPPDRTFDPHYSNKQDWEDIKSDSSAIGFYYKLGEEDGRYLAFSRSKQKVVLYFNCC